MQTSPAPSYRPNPAVARDASAAQKLIDDIRTCADLGMSVRQAAERLDLGLGTVIAMSRRYGIELAQKVASYEHKRGPRLKSLIDFDALEQELFSVEDDDFDRNAAVCSAWISTVPRRKDTGLEFDLKVTLPAETLSLSGLAPGMGFIAEVREDSIRILGRPRKGAAYLMPKASPQKQETNILLPKLQELDFKLVRFKVRALAHGGRIQIMMPAQIPAEHLKKAKREDCDDWGAGGLTPISSVLSGLHGAAKAAALHAYRYDKEMVELSLPSMIQFLQSRHYVVEKCGERLWRVNGDTKTVADVSDLYRRVAGLDPEKTLPVLIV
jgi:hypothetical protein